MRSAGVNRFRFVVLSAMASAGEDVSVVIKLLVAADRLASGEFQSGVRQNGVRPIKQTDAFPADVTDVRHAGLSFGFTTAFAIR